MNLPSPQSRIAAMAAATAAALISLASLTLYAQSTSNPPIFATVITVAPETRIQPYSIPTLSVGSSSSAALEFPSGNAALSEGAMFRREEPHASGFRRAARLSAGLGQKMFNSTFFSTTRLSVPATDRVLLGAVAAVRVEDAITTPRLFRNGAQEDLLPDWMARSNVAMLSLGIFATNAQYKLTRFLIDHGHTNIARFAEVAHTLSVGYYATQNIPAHHIYIVR